MNSENPNKYNNNNRLTHKLKATNAAPPTARPSADAPTLVTLWISERSESADPNLPSHFMPGAGTDHAWFTLQDNCRPTWDELATSLQLLDPDFMLIEYDAIRGMGHFAAIDSDVPPIGLLTLPTPPKKRSMPLDPYQPS